jgi:hypothetical protein
MTGRVQDVPANVAASSDVFDPPGGMENERLRVLLLERGLKPEDLAAEVTGYPYECGLKDQRPDTTVISCATHGVWWAEP